MVFGSSFALQVEELGVSASTLSIEQQRVEENVGRETTRKDDGQQGEKGVIPYESCFHDFRPR